MNEPIRARQPSPSSRRAAQMISAQIGSDIAMAMAVPFAGLRASDVSPTSADWSCRPFAEDVHRLGVIPSTSNTIEIQMSSGPTSRWTKNRSGSSSHTRRPSNAVNDGRTPAGGRAAHKDSREPTEVRVVIPSPRVQLTFRPRQHPDTSGVAPTPSSHSIPIKRARDSRR